MLWLTIIYFLSRLPFIKAYPVFYDAFEYSIIAQNINFSNFTQVISTSHQPIHTLYFLTILLFKNIFFFLPTNTVLVLIALLFGYLVIIFFLLFIREYLAHKQAFFACLLLMLFPYFFIANTNILYESELLFFQTAGLYFLLKGLKSDNKFIVILAATCFGLSILIFTGSLIILPVFFVFFFQYRKVKWLAYFLPLLILLPLVIDFSLFRSSAILFSKYQLHLADLTSANKGFIIFIFRIIRNIALESLAILSPIGTIALLIALVLNPRKAFSKLLYILAWLIPTFFLMQFWHSGLFGRLAIFLVIPSALFLTEAFTQKWQKYFLTIVLALALIPTLIDQGSKPALYRSYSLIENEKNLAIITSDSNRFLYQKNNLPIFVLNPGGDTSSTEKFIDENLQANKIVLIDSAGLTYPYFQFDGNAYQILSKNKSGLPVFDPLKEKYQLTLFKTDLENKKIFFDQILNNER